MREIVASGVGVGLVSAPKFGQDDRLVLLPIQSWMAMIMDEVLICLRERRNSKLANAFFGLAPAR